MASVGVGPASRLRIYTTAAQYGRVFREVLLGRTNSGDDVATLEKRLAADLGVRHAIAMPLARVGIYQTVKALITPGQEVVMSPYTIADVVNMVICAGGKPRFVDLAPGTCNIDADLVEQQMTDRTGAVLVTHFYGRMCNVEKVAEICRRRGVPLIEDAAQAFGASRGGKPAGAFGDAGIYSFGMYKNVNAFYGGMVVTNRDDLAARLRAAMADLPPTGLSFYVKKVISALATDVVTHPLAFRTIFFRFFRTAFLRGWDGINNKLKIDVDPKRKTSMPDELMSRMRPVQARLIMSQLANVDRDTQARIEAARIYREGLKDIAELTVPEVPDDTSHMFWYYPILYRDRHALVGFAMRQGRDISESYHRNCADLPCFDEFKAELPVARATEHEVIYLPTYPRYRHDEVRANVRAIRKFFNRGR